MSCTSSGLRTAALPRNVSFADAAALLDDGQSRTWQRTKLRQGIEGRLKAETPCGPILDSVSVPLLDGGEYEWHFLRPAACLCSLCQGNEAFGDFLSLHPTPRIACYMDEVKPGNVLKPDAGRGQACFYWTVVEWPSWFQVRDCGWMFFGAFPQKLLSNVAGGYSALFAKMLGEFFENSFMNFRTGFPCRTSAGLFALQASLGFVTSDEKALQQLWLLRGASGTKPCPFCSNVIGHMPASRLQDDEELVHYTCRFPHRFRLHTSQSFQLMRDRLEAVKDRKKDLKEKGQLYGLSYDEKGVLWHPTLRSVVDPVQHTMMDWMHILAASGGLAQYSLNEFCKELQQHNMDLKDLDAFAAVVTMPKARPKLPRNFLQERVCKEEGAHMRCFASEVLQVTMVLKLLVETCLLPGGTCPAHCEAALVLSEIFDILTEQEGAVELVGELRAVPGNQAGKSVCL